MSKAKFDVPTRRAPNRARRVLLALVVAAIVVMLLALAYNRAAQTEVSLFDLMTQQAGTRAANDATTNAGIASTRGAITTENANIAGALTATAQAKIAQPPRTVVGFTPRPFAAATRAK